LRPRWERVFRPRSRFRFSAVFFPPTGAGKGCGLTAVRILARLRRKRLGTPGPIPEGSWLTSRVATLRPPTAYLRCFTSSPSTTNHTDRTRVELLDPAGRASKKGPKAFSLTARDQATARNHLSAKPVRGLFVCQNRGPASPRTSIPLKTEPNEASRSPGR